MFFSVFMVCKVFKCFLGFRDYGFKGFLRLISVF